MLIAKEECPNPSCLRHNDSLAGVLLGYLAYMGLKSLGAADKLLAVLPAAMQGGTAQLVSFAVLLAVAVWVYRKALR